MFAMMKIVYTTILLMYIWISSSQMGYDKNMEIGHIEYKALPELNDMTIQTYTVNLDVPLVIKHEEFVVGLNYRHHDIHFENIGLNSSLNSYDDIHTIRLKLKYNKAFINNWSLGIVLSPTLSSTFEDDINQEDFIFNNLVSLEKTWEKQGLNSTFKVGFALTTSI